MVETKKLLIVSGANGAVGAEIVSLALSHGNRNVVGLGRRSRPLDPRKYENGMAKYFQFDVLGSLMPEHLDAVLTEPTLCEVSWVHAVGAFHNYNVFSGETLSNLDDLVRDNFVSTVHALHFWLRSVIPIKKGRFIAYSSVTASRSFPFSAVFNASKTAVESLIASVSNEVLIPEVTANCIALPTINTPAELALKPTADHAHWLSPSAVAQITVTRLDDPLGKYLRGATVPFYDPSVTFHGDSVANRYGKSDKTFIR
jgi:NADP-dependent 3-hydroxy acid dehydrogenase YdfG